MSARVGALHGFRPSVLGPEFLRGPGLRQPEAVLRGVRALPDDILPSAGNAGFL